MRHGLLPAILAAVGYALLELEFFARRNLLLPWEPGHLVAGALFLLVHGVVAIGALLLSAVLAARFAKQAVQAADETVLAAGLEQERRLYELAMATEDRVEGTQAFIEKRKPEFRGR